MRRDYERFAARGAEVISVGPESQEEFQSYWESEQMPFVGLADPAHVVSRLYRQGFKLLRFGRMPALIVIDRSGRIRYSHYGESMRDIPENEAVLALLDRLNLVAQA